MRRASIFRFFLAESSLSNDRELLDRNRSLQKDRIEPNIDILKTELGLREEDFIRVPCMFDKYGASLVPNMVNSAVLNGNIFIVAPKAPPLPGGRSGRRRRIIYRLEIYSVSHRCIHSLLTCFAIATMVNMSGLPNAFGSNVASAT